MKPKFTEANTRKSCDTCASQEGRHYCLLFGVQVKNMDTTCCDVWTERDCPLCGGSGMVCPVVSETELGQAPGSANYQCPNCTEAAQ